MEVFYWAKVSIKELKIEGDLLGINMDVENID